MPKNIFSSLNWSIVLGALALSSLGILMLFSVDPKLAFQQIGFVAIGLILFFFVSHFDYRLLEKFAGHFLVICFVLLLMLFFWGTEAKGAVRWIELGIFRFQPAELVKILLIIILAVFLSRKNVGRISNFFLSLLLVVSLAVLVFRQPDLGNAVVYLAIWTGMVVVSGANFLHLGSVFLTGFLAFPLIWFFLASYQKERILSFLSPGVDPLGAGYSVLQATIAIGSGQLFGRGFGHGTQSHLQFLPAQTTDFIFAVLAEELGLIGALIFLSIFAFLVIRVLKVVTKIDDWFGVLVVVGVATFLLFQTFVNVGMNLGLVPVVGVTLPLISYGGSSVITTYLMLGLVASVARFAPRR